MIGKFVSAWQAGQVEAAQVVPLNAKIGLSTAGILLATVAGTDWLYSSYILPVALVAGLAVVMWMNFRQGDNYLPHIWLVVVLPVVVLISLVVNASNANFESSYGAVTVTYFFALIAFMLPAHIDGDIIKFAFVWAGRIFPFVCIALKFAGVNVNVLGLYCVIFAGVAIANKKIGLVVVYAGLMLWLGGRSAIMAIAMMLMVGYNAPWAWWVSAGLAVPFLMALRPQTIGQRVIIWADAINLFRASPVFGIGPGGLMAHNQSMLDSLARQQVALAYADNFIGWPVAEFGGNPLHAHNLILQVAVETGAVGVVALALAGAWLWWRWPTFEQWQRLIIIGVLVCGIMDYPFMLAGPTILFALVAGYKRGGEGKWTSF